MIAVAQILPSQIQNGNLARHLQLALEEDSSSDIYISVRGQKEPDSSSHDTNP